MATGQSQTDKEQAKGDEKLKAFTSVLETLKPIEQIERENIINAVCVFYKIARPLREDY
ncbi:hypothetical protein KAR91_66905 [Candidatus Pacearchaeota archaeon]|nr:hypothetical protein [Candidatus Pacearchaeota archaeon]